jgi:hypothetical protein
MHDFELRMSKMEMVLGCTAGYHKSLELDSGSNEAADDGTGTHHLIDTCFKYGFCIGLHPLADHSSLTSVSTV